MKETEDFVYQNDLETIANSDLPIEGLRSKTVLITGATGLIGSQLTRALACINRIHNAHIRILLFVRSEEKANSVFGDLLKRDDIKLVIADILDNILIDGPVDYIFHCASVTASKVMITNPVETIDTAVQGTKNILELSRNKKCKSVIYVSSMEVYGRFFEENTYVDEKKMGYVDPLMVRSNYPLCKRLCENMCIAYYSEYSVPVKIVRLSQTFGAGVLPGENRIFAQIARSVIKEKNIVLHTEGKSEGNYCYTADAVRALLICLIKGADGEAYNIANEDSHTTIAQMSYMVAEQIADGKIKVVFDIPKNNDFGYAADTKMKLDTRKIRELGWEPEINLKEAYMRLIESIKLTESIN